MTLFVAIGSAAVVQMSPAFIDSGKPDYIARAAAQSVLIPFAFGLMITVMVFAIGDISGANLNPAVSLALFVMRKMSALRFICYVSAQMIGACIGSAYVRSIYPELFDAAGGAANAFTASASSANTWRAIGAEMLGTFLLVFTVCAAADVGRERLTKYVGAMTPLAIGLAVFLAHIFIVPIDGCSINPARSFGSAAVTGKWDSQWIFWVGPFLGALCAALVWEFIFKGPQVRPRRALPSSATSSNNLATLRATLPSATAPTRAAIPSYSGVGRSNSVSSFISDNGGVNDGLTEVGDDEAPENRIDLSKPIETINNIVNANAGARGGAATQARLTGSAQAGSASRAERVSALNLISLVAPDRNAAGTANITLPPTQRPPPLPARLSFGEGRRRNSNAGIPLQQVPGSPSEADAAPSWG
jgi:aquaporin PIP